MGLTKIKYKIPLELMSQDPNSGMWKFGTIEMTGAQYTIAETLNDIKDEIDAIHKTIIKLTNQDVHLAERITKLELK